MSLKTCCNSTDLNEPLDQGTCNMAAKHGHLDCMKYSHENGCPWDERTCEYVAKYGHLDCLKYAHENGCSWDKWLSLIHI